MAIDSLVVSIDIIRTKTREELRPLQMRMKETRERFLKELAEKHVGGPGVSQKDITENLKIGWGTIRTSLNNNGHKIRRLKDDDGEFWLLIDKKEDTEDS